MSTKVASVGSSLTSGGVCSKYGLAGSVIKKDIYFKRFFLVFVKVRIFLQFLKVPAIF